MLDRVSTLHALIAQQRQMGIVPLEMHANQSTCDSFTYEANLSPILPPDTRSLVARVRFPQDAPAPRYEFDGVRIVPNPKVLGGAIILRPQQLMGDPLWIEHHIRYSEPQQPSMPATGTPWHAPQENTPSGAVDAEKGVLEALSDGGGVNPTSVLLKAMDGLDAIQDVVVLRFYKDKSIDMCSTMNRYGVIGGLQAAMGYVMNGND